MMDVDSNAASSTDTVRVDPHGDNIIRSQTYVIVHAGGEKRVFFHVKPGELVKAERKSRVKCDPVIGKPFGALYRVTGGNKQQLTPVASHLSVHHSFETSITDMQFIPEADNSKLVDDNRAQALSHDDIATLKSELEGEELVQRLAENSSTFEKKTEFAQEKYLSKKKKKYITEVKFLKSTAFTLSEAYFIKKPDRVLHMRPDTLALLLAKANLNCLRFNQVLVFDTASSLVLAALVERMGDASSGRLLAGYPGTSPTPDSVRMLNYPKDVVENMLSYFPLRLVRKLEDNNLQDPVAQYLRNGSDSLVIATHYNTGVIFWELFPLLKLAGSFVVFCGSIEPLSAIAFKLKQNMLAVNIQLSDNWFREYQVLPGRTHPKMSMSATGGYILSGIKVSTVKVIPSSKEDKQVING